MAAEREDYIVERTVELLQTKLQPFFTAAGLGNVPNTLQGYSKDVITIARNDADSIRVWCDSTQPIRYFATQGWKDELYTIGVLVVYNALKQDFGPAKRRRGEAIRRCIEANWPAWYDPIGLRVKCNSDYRFATERMTGGSRRGLIGEITDKGNTKEAFTMAFLVEARVYEPILHEL